MSHEGSYTYIQTVCLALCSLETNGIFSLPAQLFMYAILLTVTIIYVRGINCHISDVLRKVER